MKFFVAYAIVSSPFSLHSLSVFLPISMDHCFQTMFNIYSKNRKENSKSTLQCSANAMRSNVRNSFNVCKRFLCLDQIKNRKRGVEYFQMFIISFEWCSNIGIVYKSNDPSVIFHVHTHICHQCMGTVHGLGWSRIPYLTLPSSNTHRHAHINIEQFKWSDTVAYQTKTSCSPFAFLFGLPSHFWDVTKNYLLHQ